MLKTTVAALAALAMGTEAVAAVPSGSLGLATSGYRLQAQAGEGVPPAYSQFESGNGPGAINRSGGDGAGSTTLVSGYINYGATPTLSAYVQAQGTAIAALVLSMRYDFLVTAANQAAYDDLAAYLALDPNNGFSVVGNYAVNNGGSGSTDAGGFAFIDAGFGPVNFQCTPGGGDCTGVAVPYLTTAVATGDAGTLSFSGTILLGAEARALTNTSVGTNQSAYAMIDPVISLPQGFAGDPGQYSVGYSPNLTGGGTVPEPASWLMLIVGFGLIGAMRRRARPVAA